MDIGKIRTIKDKDIEDFSAWLRAEEKEKGTIDKYTRDIGRLICNDHWQSMLDRGHYISGLERFKGPNQSHKDAYFNSRKFLEFMRKIGTLEEPKERVMRR